VAWRRRPEPVLDRETVDGAVRRLMGIDVELDLLVVHLGLRDGEGQEEEDGA